MMHRVLRHRVCGGIICTFSIIANYCNAWEILWYTATSILFCGKKDQGIICPLLTFDRPLQLWGTFIRQNIVCVIRIQRGQFIEKLRIILCLKRCHPHVSRYRSAQSFPDTQENLKPKDGHTFLRYKSPEPA